MDKLVELLQQIADLAGVGIDALKSAKGSDKGEGGPPPEAPAPAPEGGPPPEQG